jgi:hypothetical protein
MMMCPPLPPLASSARAGLLQFGGRGLELTGARRRVPANVLSVGNAETTPGGHPFGLDPRLPWRDAGLLPSVRTSHCGGIHRQPIFP